MIAVRANTAVTPFAQEMIPLAERLHEVGVAHTLTLAVSPGDAKESFVRIPLALAIEAECGENSVAVAASE